MATLTAVRHQYEDSPWLLDIPRLDIASGQVTAIIGPNGSGKSTLLRILAGILVPSRGEVRLAGRLMQELPRRDIARQLGYLPQSSSAEYDYTVEEIVCMGRYPHLTGLGILTRHDWERIDAALILTELQAFRQRPLSHLSGGERKRAFLASVLAQEPRVLLLDEPTNELDLHHQVSLAQLLRRLAGDGMGIVIVTHDVNLASLFADRLLVLCKGTCLADGPSEQVLTQELVNAVYGSQLMVLPHPQLKRPVLLPMAE
jgi:iron complex transport system ATP-binding protein